MNDSLEVIIILGLDGFLLVIMIIILYSYILETIVAPYCGTLLWA